MEEGGFVVGEDRVWLVLGEEEGGEDCGVGGCGCEVEWVWGGVGVGGLDVPG